MMEAIGVAEFDTYFTRIKRLTKPGGFALVHCIGRMSPPGTTAPFLRKYIFPGGYVPALSEVFASLERTGTLGVPTARICACITIGQSSIGKGLTACSPY